MDEPEFSCREQADLLRVCAWIRVPASPPFLRRFLAASLCNMDLRP
jgi:hypothetical protein